MSHPAAVISLVAVSVLSTVLCALAFRAYRASGERRLLFLVGSFGLFAVKGAITAWALRTDMIEHEALEMVNGGLDLAIVLLLMAPFIRR